MAQKDYYSILGVNKNATEDDIKKAYKKLCMKYHPDRWVNASDAEKKDAEEKFKDINEANSVLSDKQKRQNYDMFGTADGPSDSGDGWNPFGNTDPFSFFKRRSRPKGNDITANVTITFREAFSGGKKTVTAIRRRFCTHCNGTGSADGLSHSCPHCNGTGIYRNVQQLGNTSFISQSPCPYCGGTGKEITKKCKFCDGTGYEPCEEKMTIEIPVGIYDGATVTYDGMGESSTEAGGIPGNLVVMFTVIPEKNFRKEGTDLIFNLELTLLEAWEGCKKTVEHLDGTKINVEIPPLTKCKSRFVVHGKGFRGGNRGLFPEPDGDFVIEINYKIPTKKLTKEQKEILSKFYE